MTDSGPKCNIFKFLKIIFCSFAITILLLFTVASLRTLSLDVNAGLQLARWEKTNNISLVIDHHQREELLARFKGNVWRESNDLAERRGETSPLTDDRLTYVHAFRGYPDPHRVPLRDGYQHHRAA